MKIQGSDTSSIQNFCTKSSNFISQQKHWCWKCHLFPVATILAKQFWDTFPFSRVFVWNLQLTSHSHSQTQLKKIFPLPLPQRTKLRSDFLTGIVVLTIKCTSSEGFFLPTPHKTPSFPVLELQNCIFSPLTSYKMAHGIIAEYKRI